MGVINIFLTGALGETLDDFEHDGMRFVFARLQAGGPRQLVEGPMWAFVDWAGRAILLRPNEFRLLRFFAENPNQVHSRPDLIAGLGKLDPPIDERTVDVWIGRLRRALKSAGAGNPLRTVRSLGYVFDAP